MKKNEVIFFDDIEADVDKLMLKWFKRGYRDAENEIETSLLLIREYIVGSINKKIPDDRIKSREIFYGIVNKAECQYKKGRKFFEQKVASNVLLHSFIKIAKALDNQGLFKEADMITEIIIKLRDYDELQKIEK